MSSDDEQADFNREKFITERVSDPKQSCSSSFRNTEESSRDVPDDVYGPVLPPNFLNKKDHASATATEASSVYGCAPPSRGPKSKSKETTVETSNVYGPALPPKTKVIGPEIPEFLLKHQEEETIEEFNVSEEEDQSYGPSPSLMNSEKINYGLYRARSKAASDSSKNTGEGKTERESWMLELPPEKAVNFGLGPRQFRTKLGPEKGADRSAWTDTPSDKERKSKHPEPKDDSTDVKKMAIEERDREMDRLARKAEKKLKRKESLLEMHVKKMKKQAKKEAKKREKEKKPPERRPFDRDIDLQVNRFDESQKRAVLKKAQLLNDRFAQGESKFL